MENINAFKFAKIDENAQIPVYKSIGSAGADLYACNSIWIAPHKSATIHLGIKSEFPPTYVALIFARSGLASKEGLAPANKVGVIDSDYRGEWQVVLYNHSDSYRQIKIGDRVAQVVFQQVHHALFEEVPVDELSDTSRGEGGFGSTGK